MKIQKEMLVKHHFWILLGIFTPLVFLAMIMLWTNVAEAIDERSKHLVNVEQKVGSIVQRQNLKNDKWFAGLSQKEQELAKQKTAVWEQAWKSQQGLMTWPPSLVKDFPELARRDFGDLIKEPDLRERYMNDKKEGYEPQLQEIVAIVQPVNEKGKGVVQYRDGWKKILRHVDKWISTPFPTSEELWLAQEDLWVQRELLQAVRAANDFSAVYKKADAAPKLDAGKGELDHQVFTSPRWKVELILTRDQLKWRITNLDIRQQTLGFVFQVKSKGSKEPFSFLLDGEPLTPDESSPWGAVPCKVFGFNKLDGLEQELDWRTAPVKRIDKIELGYSAHRTANRPAKPAPVLSDLPAGPAGPGPAPGGLAAHPGAVPPPLSAAQQQTVSGLERNRYIDVNHQVRRMSVGMVLVVDQDNMQDVLTAIANSRLRIQITQVHWQHFRGSIKPAITEETAPAPVGPKEGKTLPGREPIKSRPIGATPRPAGKEPAGGSENASNLVTLAVYGVASLYHKYREIDEPQPGQPRPGGGR